MIAVATSISVRRRRRPQRKLWRAAVSWSMLLPFIALFAGFVLWPLANSLVLGFTSFNGIRQPEYVGLANFQRLPADERFLHALSNTLIYVVASVSFTALFALALALAFHGPGWGDRIMRTIFFLPSVTSTI